MATSIIADDEFGEISVRYYPSSRSLRFRLTPKGQVTISAPLHTPKFAIMHALKSNRTVIRDMIVSSRKDVLYDQSMPIGKSHRLAIVVSSLASAPKIYTKDRIIHVHVRSENETRTRELQQTIQKEVIKALRKEAKAYLPRRLQFLATRHGYSYETTRLTHAGTRWGSCSSSGTISLNIALMKLEIDVIDYVLIHELCHTLEMNHSTSFWQRVEQADPNYTHHRKLLKTQSPAL